MSEKKLSAHRMRWFFLVLIVLWVFTAMLLPIIVFCLTKDPIAFSLFTLLAPPVYILRRITFYLFPKDGRDYKLEEIKALHRGTRKRP
jgi:hypothetical protein